eukprot:SM000012S25412  [mRNA]  locus=s12:978549:979647:- [translate_table: standard]
MMKELRLMEPVSGSRVQIALIVQVTSWTAQFLGHGLFEGRAPALLDNLVQAFLMAPYFVLLEVLHGVFGYEPAPGFWQRVNGKIAEDVQAFKDKKESLVT